MSPRYFPYLGAIARSDRVTDDRAIMHIMNLNSHHFAAETHRKCELLPWTIQ
jgi:hypothetical protein